MAGKSFKSSLALLSVCFLAGSFTAPAVFGQSGSERTDPLKIQDSNPLGAAGTPARPSSPDTSVLSRGTHRSRQENDFYAGFWGVDQLEVRSVASGSLIRFNYRVVDVKRAQMFDDKRATAVLIDEKTGNILQVPALPKVGMLRQTGDLEQGREYWIAFSNKGFVRPGSRVDVVVGNFRANGLIVH